MTDDELKKLLVNAAEEGAVLALKRIGLGDDEAQNDIHDMRDFIRAWNNTKKTAWGAVVRWVVILALGAIAVAVGVKTKILGGG